MRETDHRVHGVYLKKFDNLPCVSVESCKSWAARAHAVKVALTDSIPPSCWRLLIWPPTVPQLLIASER
jgi:hypothetical protein